MTMQRTHPLAEDLDWMPRELKLGRWSVTGASWAGSVAAAGALTVASAGMLVHVAALTGAAGVYAGGRLGRAFMLRRLERLARGRLDLVHVGHLEEGELAHVAGKVAATETVTGLLHGVRGVYRRLVFRWRGRRYVHEAAVDFDVVDASGARVKVEVDDARLLLSTRKDTASYPRSLFAGPGLPPSLRAVLGDELRAGGGGRGIDAVEFVLQPGTPVQVVGYKTQAIDPTLGTRVGHDVPMRAALRSGRVPLLITPAVPAPAAGSDDGR